jgi:hypothetical protein
MVLGPGELPPPLHDAKKTQQMSFAWERMHLISMYLFRCFQEHATGLRTVILQSIGPRGEGTAFSGLSDAQGRRFGQSPLLWGPR